MYVSEKYFEKIEEAYAFRRTSRILDRKLKEKIKKAIYKIANKLMMRKTNKHKQR